VNIKPGTSLNWKYETPESIVMSFIKKRDVAGIVNVAKFDFDQWRGFQPADS
jgi:hypothetical protein